MGFSNLNDGEMLCTERTGIIEPHTRTLELPVLVKVCRAPASAKLPHTPSATTPEMIFLPTLSYYPIKQTIMKVYSYNLPRGTPKNTYLKNPLLSIDIGLWA